MYLNSEAPGLLDQSDDLRTKFPERIRGSEFEYLRDSLIFSGTWLLGEFLSSSRHLLFGGSPIAYNWAMSPKNLTQTYRREVEKIVATLAADYQPEKIILFGGVAQGRIRENSDIDLLIIKKTRQRYLDRVKKVALLLDTWFPTDIFVLTPQELQKAIDQNRFFIVEEILPKGKVIYEKT